VILSRLAADSQTDLQNGYSAPWRRQQSRDCADEPAGRDLTGAAVDARSSASESFVVQLLGWIHSDLYVFRRGSRLSSAFRDSGIL